MSAKETVLAVFDRLKSDIKAKQAERDFVSKEALRKVAEAQEIEADKAEAEKMLQDMRYPRLQKHLDRLRMQCYAEQNRLLQAGDVQGATYAAGGVDMINRLQGILGK